MATEKRKFWQYSFFWYGLAAFGLLLGFAGWILKDNYDYKFKDYHTAEAWGWGMIIVGGILFLGVMAIVWLQPRTRK